MTLRELIDYVIRELQELGVNHPSSQQICTWLRILFGPGQIYTPEEIEAVSVKIT